MRGPERGSIASLRALVGGLGPWTEGALVLGPVLGPAWVGQARQLLRTGARPVLATSSAGLWRMAGIELLLLLVLGTFLGLRGWRRRDLPIHPDLAGTATGLGLGLIAWILYGLVVTFMAGPLGLGDRLQPVALLGRPALPPVLAVLLVNALLEEALFLGYLTRVLERQGPAFVVGLSALLRLSVHLHHGPQAVAAILPMGILFATTYWYGRRLWPPVLAHALLGLLPLARQALT